jgi:hypothetical protein
VTVLLDRLKVLVAGSYSWQRLGSLALVGVGWLLSPLCWWNDLLFNLPLAVAFAKLVEIWNPDAFLPALVVGYWLSNVVGIVLMQSGALGLLPGERIPNRGRELLVGLLTSSAYTVAVLGLVKLGWLSAPLDLLDAVGSGHGI